jgi:putative ABC transport system substrate-binding protein
MRNLGYIEGKNVSVDWRYADGHFDRLPGLAEELVKSNVEVIVTHATPGTQAAQRATRTIPIVTAAVLDPVGNGLVASLARPGGNITGLSVAGIDVSPKQFELLKILVLQTSAWVYRVGQRLSPPQWK